MRAKGLGHGVDVCGMDLLETGRHAIMSKMAYLPTSVACVGAKALTELVCMI